MEAMDHVVADPRKVTADEAAAIGGAGWASPMEQWPGRRARPGLPADLGRALSGEIAGSTERATPPPWR